MNIREAYIKAKQAKVGESVTCPSCKTTFTKITPQQAFCKSKGKTVCKDKYWNTVIPTKRCNTTRISPASRAFMAMRTEQREERAMMEDYDPGDSEYWDNSDNFHEA
jgi:hypothetical protein